jgi:hypothetical protein
MPERDEHRAILAAGAEIPEDGSLSMEGALFYLIVLSGPLVLLQAGFYSPLWGCSDLRGGLAGQQADEVTVAFGAAACRRDVRGAALKSRSRRFVPGP